MTEEQNPGTGQKPVVTETARNIDRRSILIIDKDPVSLFLTKEILEYDNHTVFMAKDFTAGMEIYMIHCRTISMVLCEANTLTEESANIIAELKEINPALLIVVAVSEVELKKLGNLVHRNSVSLLMKPYDGKMLKHFVRGHHV